MTAMPAASGRLEAPPCGPVPLTMTQGSIQSSIQGRIHGRIIAVSNSEKISVTLPSSDLAFLSDYMRSCGSSRSGALHDAVKALREQSLEAAYELAHEEWIESGEAAVWDEVSNGGIGA